MATKKRNPFDVDESSTENDSGDVLAGLYGGVPDGIPDSGRIVAKPLPIMSIYPDPTQPRKILPREVHAGRAVNPSDMPSIIQAWLEAIYDTGIEEIPVEDILLGKYRGSDKDNSLSQNKDPLVEPFVSLLWLASDIRDTGLKDAIRVVETRKDEYLLVFGERRWTAYHILKMFLGDKYANIPAQITRASAWEIAKAQAAENFHKRQLTAVGVARQLAKLLILARQDTQDPPYDSWDALVVDGGCDRPYFAQVADGNIHRIPKGMGDEFERTLSISVEQMRQYRGLLRLTGDYDIDNHLWNLGDDRNWAERFMRDIAELDLPVIRQIFSEAKDPEEMFREAVSSLRADKKSQNTVTIGNGIAEPTPEEAAPKSPFSGDTTGAGSSTKTEGGNRFKFGDEVVTRDGPGRIIQTMDNTHLVRLDAGATKRYGDISLQAKTQSESWFGRYGQNPAGGEAEVIADLGEFCEVQYADGGRGNLHKMYLSQISKEEYDEAVQRHKASAGAKRYLYVRGAQGIAKILQHINSISFRLQFPDGEEFEADKLGWVNATEAEWNAAVAALEAAGEDEDGQEEDAAPDFKFKVGERVLVRIGMGQAGGTVVAIRPEQKQPYTVKLDNGNVSNYTVWMLDVVGNQASASGELIQIGDEVLVNYNGREFIGTVRYTEGTGEKPYGVHNNETRSTHYYSRDALALRKKGGGSDNANSLPPDSEGEDTPDGIKPRDWAGRPALWKENDAYSVNVFVQEYVGNGMLRVATGAGNVTDVHFSQLKPVPSDSTKLSDFMKTDPDADHTHLLGKRVRLGGQLPAVGKVTAVNGTRLELEFGVGHRGSAGVELVLEVIEDEDADENKVIADGEVITFLRQLGYLTRRDADILRLLGLTWNNAHAAAQTGDLESDLGKIRDSVEKGIHEMLNEFENILAGILDEFDPDDSD